ncbi:hypothetical protein EV424DRAFT_1550424 [Suillus variegatus]|nr:hypothetical protein EV424DRAFT_1550424 [Suillus variegatus]
MSVRSKAKDFEKYVKAWISLDGQGLKFKILDIMRFIARAEQDFSIPTVRDWKQTAEFALDLENRYVFGMIQKLRSYARDYLTMYSLRLFKKLGD